ncbi:HalOD1 output domain-containing protein [Halorussus sp. AFM4]|uniref:HalOD1 output domain-containing protein n=1 Tax=Halorussus sp. AFM4 TaxID=3421651 RepID=UPI003EB8B0CA
MGEKQNADEGSLVHRELDTDRNEPLSEVAEIIADLNDTDVNDLPPIYDTIDHLLTHLFDNPPSPDSQVKVQFHYAGYQITVHHQGDALFLKV